MNILNQSISFKQKSYQAGLLQNNKPSVVFNNEPIATTNSQNLYFQALVNCNKAHISFAGSQKALFNQIELRKAQSADENYREAIASKIKCKTSNIKSLAGINELHYILKNLKSEHFNPKSEDFCINLHSHTTDSDGQMTIQELLDGMVDFADNKSKYKPVYLGITNHNSLKDSIEALKIIANDPQKYKNLRLVVGIEFDTQYNNAQVFNKSVKLDMLAICIDPFNRKLNNLVNQIQHDHFLYAKNIYKDCEKIGLKLTLQEQLEFSKKSLKGGLVSYITDIRKQLLNKITTDQIEIRTEQIDVIIEKHRKQQPFTPLPYLMSKINESQTGEMVIAHPGKIDVRESLKASKTPEEAIENFLEDFKANGGTIGETHYQYPQKYYDKEQKTYGYDIPAWLKYIEKCMDKLGFYRSGGLDNHGKNLFGRR